MQTQPDLVPVAVQPLPTSPSVSMGVLVSTLAVASAASIGSNMIEVKNGSMTVSRAVANGLLKGAAASTILSRLPRQSPLEIVAACGALGVAGYMIDSIMKESKQERSSVRTESKKGRAHYVD
ncbi:MAG: hypothetical protein CSA33_01925 [Desulfobulbus propionicus]|nr:MAG: hypothetical protein CSA33_01925 [Desulfobulbus propionicus]